MNVEFLTSSTVSLDHSCSSNKTDMAKATRALAVPWVFRDSGENLKLPW